MKILHVGYKIIQAKKNAGFHIFILIVHHERERINQCRPEQHRSLTYKNLGAIPSKALRRYRLRRGCTEMNKFSFSKRERHLWHYVLNTVVSK